VSEIKTTVGLLGCGNVGSGVAKMLLEDHDFINEKMGWPLALVKIAVRRPEADRPYNPPADYLTTDPGQIVGNRKIQVVAELMGGLEPARTLVLEALRSGQHVVTANKALLAHHGREIFAVAAQNKVEVLFEAAVAGGIPIIRTLKEGLSANRFRHIFGILNGTTNYILTRMTQGGLTFQAALAEAQEAGYAEADPTLDVEGLDAAHKLVLLTALAHGALPSMEGLYVEGITNLAPEDIEYARELGYVIKLLAVSALGEDGGLEVRLHPAMLPRTHLLAEISGPLNAVLVSGHAVGDVLMTGAGAGMMPTASSVLTDLMDLARADRVNSTSRVPTLGWSTLRDTTPKLMSETRTAYYLRFTVADRPGVLAAIAKLLAERGISLAQVIQKNPIPGQESVALVMLTHLAQERDLKAALADSDRLETVLAPTKLIRVETRL
jgi:homoserine dehydrogenase